MANSLNKTSLNSDSIVGVISSDNFSELTTEMQKQTLKMIDDRNKRNGGIVGKIFGTQKDLASMNVAFVICVLLLVAGFIINEQQFWDKLIPIVAATIGYIFGKGKD